MTKWHLLTFGGGQSNFHQAAARLANQGDNCGFFASSKGLTEEDLINEYPEFMRRHEDFLSKNSRGYGYWVWKPLVILTELEKIQKGDGLLYLDAGCHLNLISLRSKLRLRYYMLVAKLNNSLAFQLQPTPGWPDNLSEKAWSKKILTDWLKLSGRDLDSNQIQATAVFLIKTPENIDFLREWYSLCIQDDYRFLNDETFSQNYPEFQEHRHDQSIFSCLYKISKRKALQDQNWFAPNWEDKGRHFPIWAKRDRHN